MRLSHLYQLLLAGLFLCCHGAHELCDFASCSPESIHPRLSLKCSGLILDSDRITTLPTDDCISNDIHTLVITAREGERRSEENGPLFAKSFPRLASLTLQEFQFPVISAQLLSGSSVTKLTLRNNVIERPQGVLCGLLNTVFQARLSSNSLTANSFFCGKSSLGPFSRSQRLQSLKISGDNLHGLPRNALVGLRMLNTLRIQDASLTDNDVRGKICGPISFLNGLKILDLTGNLLTTIGLSHLKCLTRLEQLILANNRIKQVESKLLMNQKSLSELDMSRNRLESLVPADLFSSSEKTVKIYLDDNPFRCDREIQPLTQWLHSQDSQPNARSQVIRYERLRCREPAELSGHLLTDISSKLSPRTVNTGSQSSHSASVASGQNTAWDTGERMSVPGEAAPDQTGAAGAFLDIPGYFIVGIVAVLLLVVIVVLTFWLVRTYQRSGDLRRDKETLSPLHNVQRNRWV